jgi:hypothetical protein
MNKGAITDDYSLRIVPTAIPEAPPWMRRYRFCFRRIRRERSSPLTGTLFF